MEGNFENCCLLPSEIIAQVSPIKLDSTTKNTKFSIFVFQVFCCKCSLQFKIAKILEENMGSLLIVKL